MADIVLFHHALGLTDGVVAFADDLRAGGHQVTTPDLFDGHRFTTVDEGVAHAESLGFDQVIDRGMTAVADLGGPFVVAGLSLGVLPAQRLAQTDPRVSAAVLYLSAVPLGAFAATWPDGVALQVHLVEDDPWAQDDLPAARDLTSAADGALHLHPGTAHLVIERGSPDHDPEVAGQILERTLELLDAA